MPAWPSIADIVAKVQNGELKAVDLVAQSLTSIADKKEFDAIIATLDEPAKKRAAEIDALVAAGEKIGRFGIPV